MGGGVMGVAAHIQTARDPSQRVAHGPTRPPRPPPPTSHRGAWLRESPALALHLGPCGYRARACARPPIATSIHRCPPSRAVARDRKASPAAWLESAAMKANWSAVHR